MIAHGPVNRDNGSMGKDDDSEDWETFWRFGGGEDIDGNVVFRGNYSR